MILRRYLFLVALVLIFPSAFGQIKKTTIAEFKKYIGFFETLTLPLVLPGEIKPIRTDYDRLLFNKFSELAEGPYGKVILHDSITLTIEVSRDGKPVIRAFDRLGNSSDLLEPYFISTEDWGYNVKVYNVTWRDRSIVVMDSAILSDWNADNSDLIPESQKLYIDTVVYVIDENGKFIKESGLSGWDRYLLKRKK